MFGRWKRQGNLVKKSTLETSILNQLETGTLSGTLEITSYLSYLNESHTAVITKIIIEVAKKYQTTQSITNCNIRLRFSPLHASILIRLCSRLGLKIAAINDDDSRLYDYDWNKKNMEIRGGLFYECQLELNPNNTHNITTLIDEINSEFGDVFTKDWLNEFNIVIDILNNNNNHTSHLIPEDPEESYKKNCGRTEFTSLLMTPDENHVPAIKKMLMRGYVPQEVDGYGESPLQVTIISEMNNSDKLSIVNLLLAYGVDPFLRQHSVVDIDPSSGQHQAVKQIYGSALDYARAHNNAEVFDLITATKTHVPRSLSQAMPKVTRSSIRSFSNFILTTFQFSDGKVIRTYLSSLSEFRKYKKNLAWPLFSKGFEALNDDSALTKLQEIFNEDFSPDKAIELVYTSENLIGFNLFEKIHPEGEKIIIHWAYAFIEEGYRGYGLMLYLAFRIDYALEALNPSQQFGTFMSAVDYASYRMVGWPHFPKYQNEPDIVLVKKILDVIYKQSYDLHYDPDSTTCYIVEQIKVRQKISTSNTPVNKSTSVNEKFYRQDILGYKKDEKNPSLPRSAPMLFFVNQNNKDKIRASSNNLGINFDDLNGALAKALTHSAPLFSDNPTEKPRSSL